jgi:surface polysaccharide O-acyltransferase-like enzyme
MFEMLAIVFILSSMLITITNINNYRKTINIHFTYSFCLANIQTTDNKMETFSNSKIQLVLNYRVTWDAGIKVPTSPQSVPKIP